MEKNYYFKDLPVEEVRKLLLSIPLLVSLFLSSEIYAQSLDNALEKKVDYIERIYFSGENKEGLNTKILIALQELQEKSPTPALAKQFTFLAEIKDKAEAAENACEVLDLLAVGIYNIDASEALIQGVKTPSDKAKIKAGDALTIINKVNNSTKNLGNTATNLAWSSYLLSGGKSSSFLSGASKVAGTASKLNNIAGAAGQTGQTVKELGDLGKSLGISLKKKGKPCEGVVKKEIEVGEHIPLSVSANESTSVSTTTSTLTTVVNIIGATSSSLRTLADTLRNKSGVQSVEKAYSETLSTLTIIHSGKTDALADWIEDKFRNKFKVVDYSNGRINLSPIK